jgi:hypothetical protein
MKTKLEVQSEERNPEQTINVKIDDGKKLRNEMEVTKENMNPTVPRKGSVEEQLHKKATFEVFQASRIQAKPVS